MSEIGSGLDSPAIEQDPSIAQLQAQQSTAGFISSFLPDTGFVESLNALSGLVTIQAGTSSPNYAIVVSSDGVSTISIGVRYTASIIETSAPITTSDANDTILVDTNAGPVTITLHSPLTAFVKTYTFVNIGSGTMTIDGGGASISGAATQSTAVQWTAFTLQPYALGVYWVIV
jgi:hypothetical protein